MKASLVPPPPAAAASSMLTSLLGIALEASSSSGLLPAGTDLHFALMVVDDTIQRLYFKCYFLGFEAGSSSAAVR